MSDTQNKKKTPPPKKKTPPPKKRSVVCGRCSGVGTQTIEQWRQCSGCIGRGYIYVTGAPNLYGTAYGRIEVPCKDCGGHGRRIFYEKGLCTFCKGKKIVYI